MRRTADLEKLDIERDSRLSEIVKRLVKTYQPLHIYLFGSSARGESGPDSDYDLMLVVPDDAPPERKQAKLAYDCLWGTGTAADVVVWSRSFRPKVYRRYLPASDGSQRRKVAL